MARVTGIGGVFLRAKDPAALTKWYAEHLGLVVAQYGGVTFRWTDEVPEGTGSTTWNAFPADTKYFGEPTQQAMVNYRVDDLDALLETLAAAGVSIDPKRETYGFGKFAWITDPEGNRLELWQPIKKEAE